MGLLDLFKTKKKDEAQAAVKDAVAKLVTSNPLISGTQALSNFVPQETKTAVANTVKAGAEMQRDYISALDAKYKQKFGRAYEGLKPADVASIEYDIINQAKDENEYNDLMGTALNAGQYRKKRREQKDMLNKLAIENEIAASSERDFVKKSEYNLISKKARATDSIRDMLDEGGLDHLGMDDESVFNTFIDSNPQYKDLLATYVGGSMEYSDFQNRLSSNNLEGLDKYTMNKPVVGGPVDYEGKVPVQPDPQLAKKKKNIIDHTKDFMGGAIAAIPTILPNTIGGTADIVGIGADSMRGVGRTLDRLSTDVTSGLVGLVNPEAGQQLKAQGYDLAEKVYQKTGETGKGLQKFADDVSNYSDKVYEGVSNKLGTDPNSIASQLGKFGTDVAAMLYDPSGKVSAAQKAWKELSMLEEIARQTGTKVSSAERLGQIGKAAAAAIPEGAIDAQKFSIISEGQVASPTETAIGAGLGAVGQGALGGAKAMADRLKQKGILKTALGTSKSESVLNILKKEEGVPIDSADQLSEWFIKNNIGAKGYDRIVPDLKRFSIDNRNALLSTLQKDPTIFDDKEIPLIVKELAKSVKSKDVMGNMYKSFIETFYQPTQVIKTWDDITDAEKKLYTNNRSTSKYINEYKGTKLKEVFVLDVYPDGSIKIPDSNVKIPGVSPKGVTDPQAILPNPNAPVQRMVISREMRPKDGFSSMELHQLKEWVDDMHPKIYNQMQETIAGQKNWDEVRRYLKNNLEEAVLNNGGMNVRELNRNIAISETMARALTKQENKDMIRQLTDSLVTMLPAAGGGALAYYGNAPAITGNKLVDGAIYGAMFKFATQKKVLFNSGMKANKWGQYLSKGPTLQKYSERLQNGASVSNAILQQMFKESKEVFSSLPAEVQKELLDTASGLSEGEQINKLFGTNDGLPNGGELIGGIDMMNIGASPDNPEDLLGSLEKEYMR